MKKLKLSLSIILLTLLASAAPAFAAVKAADKKADKPQDLTGAVTQSYDADKSVVPGMLVAFKDKSRLVVPLSTKSLQDMLGLVVPVNDAPLVLTPAQPNTQQVLVAPSGQYNLLVNNQTGSIKQGDYLTISSIEGISMKATPNQPYIVGRAASNFDGKTNVIGTSDLKDSKGGSRSVSIGQVTADIKLSENPLAKKNASSIPSFMTNLAEKIAAKPVTPVKVYICAVLLIATIYITGSMLYSGVRSSILAIGRNPLGKSSILRGLLQTVIFGLLVFVAGIFGIYTILRL